MKVRGRNVPVSAVPGLFPFLAGPFAYWIGCWYEKARNTFVMSAAALELSGAHAVDQAGAGPGHGGGRGLLRPGDPAAGRGLPYP